MIHSRCYKAVTAAAAVRVGYSIRRVAVLAALSFGGACSVIYGNALAASDVADAAMRDDTARVMKLIASKADVNAPQPDGSTALHWAAYHGDLKMTGALLRAHANPGVVMENGMTPLSLACESGNAELVKELLKAGADPNQTLANGETPLMMAARTGRIPVMEALLEKGARVNEKEKLRGTTALMWAAANSNADAARFLISKGADVSARSATTPPGRSPYLAPPGRNRIEDFINGRGITFEGVKPSSDPKAQAEEEALLAKERAVAKRSLAAFPLDKPAKPAPKQWGGLTPLQFAVREGSMETVKVLVDSGADVNQRSEFGWTALLVATQNRYYKIGVYLLDHGADPNIANEGGWTPLYLATDNRNIEGGDYPTRKPDMDHLEYIKRLFASHANPNLRMRSSTETRTIFTHQWLLEEGATPFLRAAQSGDIVLLKLLLEHGADPKINTEYNVTPLMVASGIGWVQGVTYEWSAEQTLETVKMLLDLGADVNAQDTLDGRTALMGAAHKGRNDVIEVLVQHGADLSLRDIGSRDTINALSGLRFQAIDYADGLVRIGVQSAIAHPETSALLRKMMKERNLPVPQEGRSLASICVVDLCK
jgi:ankyrin repeat protein